jgi:predicted nucleotidyltransferase component of viral defense system
VRLALEDLQREAAATGFQAETLEKAIRLLGLLETLRSHPYLRTRLALKGGTALNLFVFEVPRLSVDIDLNYVGALDREVMLAERPKVEEAIQAVCGREDLDVRRVPGEHAGGKWRLTYRDTSGRPGNLELDVNFLLRGPLWPAQMAHSRALGGYRASDVPMLDLHELAAGKLAALLSRTASRDLFDARELLAHPDIDERKLRFGFVVYGAANRKDWRTVSVDDVTLDRAELRSQLLPTLRAATLPSRGDASNWGERLVSECRDRLSALLPLTESEREFIGRLNDRGDIAPELLTGDAAMQATLRAHPALRWKAINVRKRLGLGEGADDAE